MFKKSVLTLFVVAAAASFLSACDDNNDDNNNCRNFVGPTGTPVSVVVDVEGAEAEGGDGGDGGNVANQGGEIFDVDDNEVEINDNNVTIPLAF